MDDSPFRRIVLPALLASSAGFAVLTWPVASDYGTVVSQRLPHPLSHWADSALITSQHKEFSIRYIGFAILSSVAIGVTTAGVMRRQQTRHQRHQRLLKDALATPDPIAVTSAVEEVSDRPATPLGEVVNSAAIAPHRPTLDWAELLRSPAPEEPALAAAVLSTPTEAHQICQIREVSQHHCLALKMGNEYYRFYRQRPSLERTQALVQQLQRQGQRAIATRDGSGYVVWVHQPDPIHPVSPWPASLAH